MDPLTPSVELLVHEIADALAARDSSEICTSLEAGLAECVTDDRLYFHFLAAAKTAALREILLACEATRERGKHEFTSPIQ